MKAKWITLLREKNYNGKNGKSHWNLDPIERDNEIYEHREDSTQNAV